MDKVQTLKGFRDFLPKDARKRQYVINTLKGVFELYGFEPLETPALEYEEILMGKYGEEGDKLMYRFEDNGGRRVAMRYDQTVPLARVAAQYSAMNSSDGKPLLPLPFKRYQIQPVWRAENTQKGRFREFVQCDIDTVGTGSLLADAEVLKVVYESLKALGFEKFKILINDRENLRFINDVETLNDKDNLKIIRSIDKLKKIGREGVVEDLIKQGFSTEMATNILQLVETKRPTENLSTIFSFLTSLDVPSEYYQFDPALARGLDYYTGLIFEVEIDGYTAGSVCGGGRYDNLIGMFSKNQLPAVGCAFGFDRIIDTMDQLNLFPNDLTTTQVLVTVFSQELGEQSLEMVKSLREKGIAAEVYLDASVKLEKQLKYASVKGIPYVLIIGPEEVAGNVIKLKIMSSGEQKTVTLEELMRTLS